MTLAGAFQLILFLAVAGAVAYFVVKQVRKDGDKFDL